MICVCKSESHVNMVFVKGDITSCSAQPWPGMLFHKLVYRYNSILCLWLHIFNMHLLNTYIYINMYVSIVDLKK